jgi:hypothetical protein
VDASQAAITAGQRTLNRPAVIDPLGKTTAHLSKPVVVVAHGDTWNLGHEIYLAADIRIAAANTRFGQVGPLLALVRDCALVGAGWPMRAPAGRAITERWAYRLNHPGDLPAGGGARAGVAWRADCRCGPPDQARSLPRIRSSSGGGRRSLKQTPHTPRYTRHRFHRRQACGSGKQHLCIRQVEVRDHYIPAGRQVAWISVGADSGHRARHTGEHLSQTSSSLAGGCANKIWMASAATLLVAMSAAAFPIAASRR